MTFIRNENGQYRNLISQNEAGSHRTNLLEQKIWILSKVIVENPIEAVGKKRIPWVCLEVKY